MSNATCIDLSCWQVGVDFNKVKSDGINAILIRAGYGREISQKDSQFEAHYKGATDAGLKRGAYWYSYADSVEDAKREAAACLAVIKGKTFDMPIYFDLEDSSQVKLGKTTLTEIAKAFCEAIIAGGYRAGVYANLNWFSNYLDYAALKAKYSIWLAQYNTINQLDCDIWQNSSSGKISGISGNVDTNIIFNNSVFSSTSTSTSTASTSKTTSTATTSTTKSTSTSTAKTSTASTASTAAKATIPDVEYRVRAGGKWYSAVKNLEDYAGVIGQAITDVAIKFAKGTGKYRVHVKGVGWLPWVTGYDINDHVNGYAGNGSVIDAIEIYYNTPSDLAKALGYCLRAKYRVSPLNGSYYDYQFDDETSGNQDGYAGTFGKAIDRLQIVLSK